MDIEQSFSVPFSRDVVWKSFLDVEGIVTCLPGASLTEPPQGDQLALAMTVKLGPIVAAFKGQGEILRNEASFSGVVNGQGSDRKSGSRVKGSARFELLPEDGNATRVNVVVDYSITGPLAQFSRGGIVRELATRLTDAFADNLKSRLELGNIGQPVEVIPAVDGGVDQSSALLSATPETVVPVPEGLNATAAQGQPPLDLGNVFWSMLLNRVRQLLGLKAKHRCPTCGK